MYEIPIYLALARNTACYRRWKKLLYYVLILIGSLKPMYLLFILCLFYTEELLCNFLNYFFTNIPFNLSFSDKRILMKFKWSWKESIRSWVMLGPKNYTWSPFRLYYFEIILKSCNNELNFKSKQLQLTSDVKLNLLIRIEIRPKKTFRDEHIILKNRWPKNIVILIFFKEY